MILISVEDIYLPPNRGEWLQLLLTVEREGGRAKRSPQGGFNSGGSGGSGSGGFNGGNSGNGGFNGGDRPDMSGGNNGGFNSGGNNGGSGGAGGRPDVNNGGNNGEYNGGNNGGYNGGNNGGYNGGSNSGGRPDVGGSNNGGYNNGGSNGGYNGGNNAGGRPDVGGSNYGGYNNGGSNGGYNGGNTAGGRPDIGGGSNNGGYNSGGSNGGYNGGRGRPGLNDPWAHGSSSRPDYNQPPGGRTTLQTNVLFHVTSQYVTPDTVAPNFRVESVEAASCKTAQHCSDQEWTVRFAVQDDEYGLYNVRMIGEGWSSRLFWWRENHVVGSRDPIRVGAVVSCCTLAVTLEMEDMAANRMTALAAQSDEAKINMMIVIGVCVGVGVLVVIVMAVCGTCLYKKKYHGVPQDGL